MSTEQTYTYSHVAILRPGLFTDTHGNQVSFTTETLTRVAENYDPDWHPATVNIDHRESGPALGVISDLVFDGEHLRATLQNVPVDMARDITAGKYPFRSAEVYTDLDGRGPYLRAVALLGARPPAVKGLPAMPEGVLKGRQADGKWREAGSSGLIKADKPNQIIITVYQEVSMDNATPDVPEAKAMAPDVMLLAEDNHRLQEENRRLRHEQAERDVALFIGGLRLSGQLTPALESCGLAEVLMFAEEQPLTVELPERGQVPLADILRELLASLPVLNPAADRNAAEGADIAGAGLTADEREIARQLGLTELEYTEIKLGIE